MGAGPDQLIADEIRCHPNQREIAATLTNQLVSGRERNEMRESLEGDDIAVANLRDGLC